MGMNDWELVASTPGPLRLDFKRVEIRCERAPASDVITIAPAFADRFPALAKLVSVGAITVVEAGTSLFHVLSWPSRSGYLYRRQPPPEGRLGWLCPPPVPAPERALHPDHRLFLSCVGGILARFHEPMDNWLANHAEVLTASASNAEACARFRETIEASRWRFDDNDIPLPIEPSDYVPFARELNGNTTIYNRANGKVLMFARDHLYQHIMPLKGCPENTFYRIDRCPDLRRWIELLANQWRKVIHDS